MNKVLKGYKFRIYPANKQQEFFTKTFGGCRFVWNYILEVKKEAYIHAGIKSNFAETCKGLTEIKKIKELDWLNELNSQSIQQELRRLDVAYSRFFNKISEFPAFKSKHDRQSFVVPQNFSYKDGVLCIPKLKSKINVNQHKEFGLNARVLFVTISKNKTGKYFASFQVEEDQVEKKHKSDNKIGIDLGLKDLMVFSNGTRIANPKIAKKFHKKLEYQGRQLSKTKKDSKSREKAKLNLAKTYEKITNKKQDFAHKLTSKIVDENQVIIMEDLSTKSMMENHQMARSIQDVSWGEIVRQLEYKSKWNNRKFVKIDRFFPSSKMCGNCGHIHKELELKDRQWSCMSCNTTHDRDLNAANNILKQGLNILANSSEENAGLSGLGIKSDIKQKRVKPSRKIMLKDMKNIEVMKPEAASFRAR